MQRVTAVLQGFLAVIFLGAGIGQLVKGVSGVVAGRFAAIHLSVVFADFAIPAAIGLYLGKRALSNLRPAAPAGTGDKQKNA